MGNALDCARFFDIIILICSRFMAGGAAVGQQFFEALGS